MEICNKMSLARTSIFIFTAAGTACSITDDVVVVISQLICPHQLFVVSRDKQNKPLADDIIHC